MTAAPSQPAATRPPSAVWREHYATGRGERHWPCEELVRFAGRRGGLSGETVLEVGCGNGANLWMLADDAAQVVGLDLVPEALGMAEGTLRRRGRRAALVAGEMGSLPLADASVDGVVDVMTSQHVPWSAHLGLYAEFRRVLCRGGWLFVYHLAAGTTVRGSRLTGAFTYDGLPALFPEAGLTCLPPAWALRESVVRAGFAVRDSRALMRMYPDGTVATYHVLEGEAV